MSGEAEGSRQIRVELPEPPSVNDYYRTVHIKGRGQVTLLSAEGRRFKASVNLVCQLQGMEAFTGPVEVTLVWRRTRKAGDLDNRIKATLDSLQGWAYVNDKQVAALHCFVEDGAERAGCLVVVGPLLS